MVLAHIKRQRHIRKAEIKGTFIMKGMKFFYNLLEMLNLYINYRVRFWF